MKSECYSFCICENHKNHVWSIDITQIKKNVMKTVIMSRKICNYFNSKYVTELKNTLHSVYLILDLVEE